MLFKKPKTNTVVNYKREVNCFTCRWLNADVNSVFAPMCMAQGFKETRICYGTDQCYGAYSYTQDNPYLIMQKRTREK